MPVTESFLMREKLLMILSKLRIHSFNFRNGEEVFNWILEAAEEASDDWDGGRVVWILRYVIQPSADTSWMNKDPFANFGDERHKLTTRLEVQKDEIEAVLPIAKVLYSN